MLKRSAAAATWHLFGNPTHGRGSRRPLSEESYPHDTVMRARQLTGTAARPGISTALQHRFRNGRARLAGCWDGATWECSHGRGGDMAKILRCGDLMVGCQHVIRGTTEEDVRRQAAKHAAEAHNIKDFTPGLDAKVKGKIRTE